MAKFYLTNKAVEDLSQIWNYTFDQWSEEQADKYYRVLLDSCQVVANNPSLGRNYDGIAGGLLGLKVIRHIIFYRKTDQNIIEVMRILHDSMDLKNRITE